MTARMGDLVVSQAMREQLLQLGTVVCKTKNSILFTHGDPVTGVFLICSGRILLALDTVAPMFPPRILGPGCVAGLPAAVGGSPYSLTATVLEDAELIFVSRQALVDRLKQNPALCFEVMDVLSREISGTRSALKRNGVLHQRKQ